MSNDLILPPNNLDLAKLEVASVDLSPEYWTPKEVGEVKRMVFVGIEERTFLDQKTNDEIQLPCAVFIDAEHKTIVNGSKMLVAVFENGNAQNGSPFQVKYLGKKKARNGNNCDTWSVVKLAKPKEAK